MKLLSFSNNAILYGFVSIVNTIFFYGVYTLFVFLKYSYQIASLASIIIGIIFSFTTHGKLSFRIFNFKSFIRYASVWIGLYISNIWLIEKIQEYSSNLYLSGAIASLLIAFIAFFLMKYFVFR